jgi:hypothetical protein
LGATRLLAGRDHAEDLVTALEGAVSSAARGDAASCVRTIDAEASKPKNLKEVTAQVDQLKSLYQKVAPLGELDAVERLSLVYTGDSFFRVRFVEKRTEGVVLWTFIGYRLRSQWYCKEMQIRANGDLVELMKELDSADSKPTVDEKKNAS